MGDAICLIYSALQICYLSASGLPVFIEGFTTVCLPNYIYGVLKFTWISRINAIFSCGAG